MIRALKQAAVAVVVLAIGCADRVGRTWRRRTIILTVAGTIAVVILVTEFQRSATEEHRSADSRSMRSPSASDRNVLGRFAYRAAAPWVARRAASGLPIEPLTGAARHGFGPAMLAHTMIHRGAERGDAAMLDAGLRMLEANSRAAGAGEPGNPLELLGVATAYEAARTLAPPGRARRRSIAAARSYLRHWSGAQVGPEAQACFDSASCWNNYKIIHVAAVLALLDTQLPAASAASPLAHRARARANALDVLERDVPRATGRRATAYGRRATSTGLGILSDQPTYALAYHALSAAALARSLELLGDRAPPAARDAFRRAMLAEAAFMAPDGDVAYLGRAQGQSWALAATVYAGHACARLFAADDPDTAGMCTALARRAFRRLRARHGFRDGLLSIVPRFRRYPPSRAGLEHYVRVMSFTGMTALFIDWASEASRGNVAVEARSLPLDAGGAFIDPEHARFAVVRRGNVWFAVHATAPPGVKDARYELGLLSLKVRGNSRWRDALEPRPYIAPDQPFDRAGPALVTSAGLAFPASRRFEVDHRTGRVAVAVGFRALSGEWMQRDAELLYEPTRAGVKTTVIALPGSVLRFQDFVADRPLRILSEGSLLVAGRSRSRLGPAPTAVERGLLYSSSYSPALRGVRRYVTVPASGRVQWRQTAG